MGVKKSLYILELAAKQHHTCDSLPFAIIPLFLDLSHPIIFQTGCTDCLLKPVLVWNFYWENEGMQWDILKVSSLLMSSICGWKESKMLLA